MATAAGHDVIGREEELEALRTFVVSLADGPAAAVLAGEAGIGKTTLWRAGIAAARERSLRVLTAAPAEAEAKLSFSALGDLLEDAIRDVLPHLPSPQKRALALALLLDDAGGPPPDRRAVAVAFLNALRALAEPGPLLVAVDDVQWLDTPSADVLRFVVRRLRAERVGLLVTERVAGSVPLPLGLDRALSDRVDSVHVGPLTLGALHRLLHERLEASFPRPVLLRLHEASGGNPFFALELARALLRGGRVVEPGAPLPVPESLRELLHDRVMALPAPALRVLLVAAASAEPTVSLIEAGAGDGDALAGLEAGVEAGVVRLERERVRFTHPLLRSSIYSAASPQERRQAHRRLAGAADDLEERARHLALAAEGPDLAAAADLDRAALHASRRGAPAVAAELSELAARLTPVGERNPGCRRLVEAAEYHHTAGEIARARAILESLLNELPPGRERARALFQLGWTEQRFERGEELCERALAEAGEDDRLCGTIHHWLGFIWIVRGDLSRARGHGELAVALAEKTRDPVFLVRALSLLLLVDTLSGRPVPEGRLGRALALEEAAEGAPLYYPPSLVHALRLMFGDRLDEARERYEKALRIVAERGDEEMVCAVNLHLAQLECRAGNWGRAADHAAQGYELTQALGLDDRRGVLRYVQGLVAAHQGRVGEARAFAEESAALAEAFDDKIWEIEARTVLGFLELSLGDPKAAACQLRPLPGRLTAMGYREPSHYQAIPNLVEALVELGEAEEARPLVALFEELARAVDAPLALAQAARCRGLVAGATGDLEGALAALEAALVDHRRAPVPFERGRTLLALGSTRRRAKRRRAAREALMEAVAVFDELGAPLWAKKTRSELARIGGRAPSSSDMLTPTERRVAELVAEGHATKEVAAELFVSAKTVEGHLSHIYAKLGVRSRAELAARFRGIDRPRSARS
jgi:DNA-binding CsgD family transcriptional regulator